MGKIYDLINAVSIHGPNEIIEFDGGYFNFAFGNEITLCLDHKYYILNCDEKLFKEVKEFLKTHSMVLDIVSYWRQKSKEYKIDGWSDNFDDLHELYN